MRGLPPLPIAFGLVRSAAGSWIVLRLMVALVGLPARPPFGSATLVLVVAVLGWLNVRRARERLLLANLGIPRGVVLLLLVLTGAVLELALWTVLGTWWAMDVLTNPPPVGDA